MKRANTTTKEKKGTVYKHSGFNGGLELELREFKDILEYKTEYELSKRSLKMDLLVIRRKGSREITNPIASYFRGHNIIEYKSPEDKLNIDVFFKVIGYASLYKSIGRSVNEIPIDDITVTIFRHRYPRKLMGDLKEMGAAIREEENGIYRIDGMLNLQIRIIVIAQIDRVHAALRILTPEAEEDDLRRFIKEVAEIKDESQTENIHAVMEVSARLNKGIVDRIKEESSMGPVMMEIMKKELQESEARGEARGSEIRLISITRKKLAYGKSTEEIAEDLLEDVSHIEEILEAICDCAPDAGDGEVYDKMQEIKREKEAVVPA